MNEGQTTARPRKSVGENWGQGEDGQRERRRGKRGTAEIRKQTHGRRATLPPKHAPCRPLKVDPQVESFLTRLRP
jgi:hypothetical protein